VTLVPLSGLWGPHGAPADIALPVSSLVCARRYDGQEAVLAGMEAALTMQVGAPIHACLCRWVRLYMGAPILELANACPNERRKSAVQGSGGARAQG